MSNEIAVIAQTIYRSRTVSIDGMTATLLLPFREQEDPQKIAMAVAWLLNKYFGIKLTPDQVVDFEGKEKLDIIIPSDKGPFCQEVHLDYTIEKPQVQILGTPP